MKPCCHKDTQPGFTLVEVVVALAILSLVMLATVTGMRTLANTQRSLERVTARVDEVRSVSMFIRDHLESALVGTGGSGGLSLGGGTAEKAYFEGTANSVAWKAPVLFGEEYGGVHLLRVAEEDGQLVLRWQRPEESTRRVVWSDTPVRPLLNELDRFEVAFRGDLDSQWVSSWERKGNPGYVRLRIGAGGRVWPDLVMEVQQ